MLQEEVIRTFELSLLDPQVVSAPVFSLANHIGASQNSGKEEQFDHTNTKSLVSRLLACFLGLSQLGCLFKTLCTCFLASVSKVLGLQVCATMTNSRQQLLKTGMIWQHYDGF